MTIGLFACFWAPSGWESLVQYFINGSAFTWFAIYYGLAPRYVSMFLSDIESTYGPKTRAEVAAWIDSPEKNGEIAILDVARRHQEMSIKG